MGSLDRSRAESEPRENGFQNLSCSTPCLPCTLTFFGPPSKNCRSDRDCPGFRRTSCEGRGPNFLFIFPTCGKQRPYTVAGKCNTVLDSLCHIGNFLGGQNRCNDGARCADCLENQDCS